jgi:hypothetical protein
MRKIFLTEDEKNNISGQHDDIDRTIYNFLLRRYTVEEKTISTPKGIWTDEDDLPPIKWKEVHFVDFPTYSLSTFMSRKDMEWILLNMLEKAKKLNTDEFRGNQGFDPNRQKKIKTIRKFLNLVLPVK